MAERILWVDQVGNYTYLVENMEDGSVKLIRQQGDVTVEGTPLNAVNLAKIFDYTDAKVLEGGGKVIVQVVQVDPETPQNGEMWIRSDLL